LFAILYITSVVVYVTSHSNYITIQSPNADPPHSNNSDTER